MPTPSPAPVNYISTLLPIATFFLSVAVGLVAWHQWRIARDKLRLDLFEKRYKVYKAAKEFLRLIFRGDPVTEDDVGRFMLGISDAEFLFGKDVVQYLARIREQAAHLAADLWHVEQNKSKEDRLKHSRS